MDIGVTVFATDRTIAPSELAAAAEERGFHSLYVPEHTHYPADGPAPPAMVAGVDPDDYRRSLDPLVALAQAATVTSRLRLGTGVVLVAQHHPVLLAKQVATLDHLSGGRVTLGVGFGWNPVEAAAHGVAFDQRRAVAREHVLCLRALWEEERAEFHGDHVELGPCLAWPKPAQRPLPVLIGGGAGPKLFAAVAEYAQGWMPIGGAGLSSALPALRRALEAAGRDPAGAWVVPFGTVPDPGKLEHFAELGVTEVVLRVPARSRDDVLRTLDGYARYPDRFGQSAKSGS